MSKVKVSFIKTGCCYPPWPSPSVMTFEQVEQHIAVRAFLNIPMDAPASTHRRVVAELDPTARETLLDDVAAYAARLKAAGKLPNVLRRDFEEELADAV